MIHVSWRQGDAELFPDLLPGYSYATRQKPHDFHLHESDLSPGSILSLLSATQLKEGRGRVSSHEDFNLCSRSSPLGPKFLCFFFLPSCSACGSTQLCSCCCVCPRRAYSSLLSPSQNTHQQEQASSPTARAVLRPTAFLTRTPEPPGAFLHCTDTPGALHSSAPCHEPHFPMGSPRNGLHLVGAEGILPLPATPMLPTPLLLPTAGRSLPGTNTILTSPVPQGTIISGNRNPLLVHTSPHSLLFGFLDEKRYHRAAAVGWEGAMQESIHPTTACPAPVSPTAPAPQCLLSSLPHSACHPSIHHPQHLSPTAPITPTSPAPQCQLCYQGIPSH